MKLNINKTDEKVNLLFSEDLKNLGIIEISHKFDLTNVQLLSILQKHDEMLEMLKKISSFIKYDEELHDTSIKQWFEFTAKEVDQLINEVESIKQK